MHPAIALTEAELTLSQIHATIYKYDRALLKKDTLAGSARCKDRQWHACFVVLKGSHLLLYPPKMVVSRMNYIQPSIAIHLENALVLPQYHYKSSKRTILAIRLPDESSYFFQPMSPAQTTGWIHAFKEALHNMNEFQIERVRRQLEESYRKLSMYLSLKPKHRAPSTEQAAGGQSVQSEIEALKSRMAASIINTIHLKALSDTSHPPIMRSMLSLLHPAATVLAQSACTDASARSTADPAFASAEHHNMDATCSVDSDVSSILDSRSALPPQDSRAAAELEKTNLYAPASLVANSNALSASLHIQMSNMTDGASPAAISQSLYNSLIEQASPVSISSFQSAVADPAHKPEPQASLSFPLPPPLPLSLSPLLPGSASAFASASVAAAAPILSPLSAELHATELKHAPSMPAAQVAGSVATAILPAALRSRHSEPFCYSALERKTPPVASAEPPLSAGSLASQNALYTLQEIKSSLRTVDNRLDACRDELQAICAQITPTVSPSAEQEKRTENEDSPNLVSELQRSLFRRKCKQQQMIESLRKSRSRDELR